MVGLHTARRSCLCLWISSKIDDSIEWRKSTHTCGGFPFRLRARTTIYHYGYWQTLEGQCGCPSTGCVWVVEARRMECTRISRREGEGVMVIGEEDVEPMLAARVLASVEGAVEGL